MARLIRPSWRRLMLPLLLVASAFVFTGCYDEPYYGRGRGYSGVYASYGGPGPYYGGYGYDPYYGSGPGYGYGYGPGYGGPGYGSTVVAVRTGGRRGYYANRARYRNRAAWRRNRGEFRRGGEFRRRQQVRSEGNTQRGPRQGGRAGRIEAATQPE